MLDLTFIDQIAHKSLHMIIQLLDRVKNNVANGEIAHNEQYLHMPTLFAKVVCCRCIEMRLQAGKG